MFSPLGTPFTDVTDLFSHSELDGFPTDRQYTKTKQALMPNSQRRDIGHLGIWTLSSAKLGNGVDQLREDNLTTFWQSDGTQPHNLTVFFPRKELASELCIYIDYKSDESYTPSKLSVSLGNALHTLYEVQSIDLDEPLGWFNFSLGRNVEGQNVPVKTHFIQLNILQNQHNGRDTHVRQVKIFGPRTEYPPQVFSTLAFSQFAVIR